MKKITIAIIGKMAAGKGTFGIFLQEEVGPHIDVSFHRFSDPLNDALDAVGIEKNRSNQQWLSTKLREKFGEEVIGRAVQKRAEEEESDIVFLDGVRRPQDVLMLRGLSNNFLVAIDAPPEARFERLKKRADRPGDAEKTLEEFLAESNAESERMIDDIAKEADVVIDNSGTMDDLRKKVREFLHEKVKLV